jgi:hypothetical protein
MDLDAVTVFRTICKTMVFSLFLDDLLHLELSLSLMVLRPENRGKKQQIKKNKCSYF